MAITSTKRVNHGVGIDTSKDERTLSRVDPFAVARFGRAGGSIAFEVANKLNQAAGMMGEASVRAALRKAKKDRELGQTAAMNVANDEGADAGAQFAETIAKDKSISNAFRAGAETTGGMLYALHHTAELKEKLAQVDPTDEEAVNQVFDEAKAEMDNDITDPTMRAAALPGILRAHEELKADMQVKADKVNQQKTVTNLVAIGEQAVLDGTFSTRMPDYIKLAMSKAHMSRPEVMENIIRPVLQEALRGAKTQEQLDHIKAITTAKTPDGQPGVWSTAPLAFQTAYNQGKSNVESLANKRADDYWADHADRLLVGAHDGHFNLKAETEKAAAAGALNDSMKVRLARLNVTSRSAAERAAAEAAKARAKQQAEQTYADAVLNGDPVALGLTKTDAGKALGFLLNKARTGLAELQSGGKAPFNKEFYQQRIEQIENQADKYGIALPQDKAQSSYWSPAQRPKEAAETVERIGKMMLKSPVRAKAMIGDNPHLRAAVRDHLAGATPAEAAQLNLPDDVDPSKQFPDASNTARDLRTSLEGDGYNAAQINLAVDRFYQQLRQNIRPDAAKDNVIDRMGEEYLDLDGERVLVGQNNSDHLEEGLKALLPAMNKKLRESGKIGATDRVRLIASPHNPDVLLVAKAGSTVPTVLTNPSTGTPFVIPMKKVAEAVGQWHNLQKQADTYVKQELHMEKLAWEKKNTAFVPATGAASGTTRALKPGAAPEPTEEQAREVAALKHPDMAKWMKVVDSTNAFHASRHLVTGAPSYAAGLQYGPPKDVKTESLTDFVESYINPKSAD